MSIRYSDTALFSNANYANEPTLHGEEKGEGMRPIRSAIMV
jgi:hypothetical protein